MELCSALTHQQTAHGLGRILEPDLSVGEPVLDNQRPPTSSNVSAPGLRCAQNGAVPSITDEHRRHGVLPDDPAAHLDQHSEHPDYDAPKTALFLRSRTRRHGALSDNPAAYLDQHSDDRYSAWPTALCMTASDQHLRKNTRSRIRDSQKSKFPSVLIELQELALAVDKPPLTNSRPPSRPPPPSAAMRPASTKVSPQYAAQMSTLRRRRTTTSCPWGRCADHSRPSPFVDFNDFARRHLSTLTLTTPALLFPKTDV
ncbi:hypothetical protein HYPSUDRAFT_197755 [Hypholoma sublateritium FD-334 SS-4]|uniref:Uncharacterized protein n=1 Tax=Hypholoma sublateritium (strain FD-334 SS-4) TaxID=945553 RepID=A0A0D2MWA9_HYPSF|nr:hypothetical protein HYPSUDRAFT_197755 [Hypholoma sublateritium FD-334 SS-4]